MADRITGLVKGELTPEEILRQLKKHGAEDFSVMVEKKTHCGETFFSVMPPRSTAIVIQISPSVTGCQLSQ